MITSLVEKLEDPNFEGALQLLRSWVEIDGLFKAAAARIRELEIFIAQEEGTTAGEVESLVRAAKAALTFYDRAELPHMPGEPKVLDDLSDAIRRLEAALSQPYQVGKEEGRPLKRTMTLHLTDDEMAMLEKLDAERRSATPTAFRDFSITREWFGRKVALEGDLEIGAGFSLGDPPPAPAAEPVAIGREAVLDLVDSIGGTFYRSLSDRAWSESREKFADAILSLSAQRVEQAGLTAMIAETLSETEGFSEEQRAEIIAQGVMWRLRGQHSSPSKAEIARDLEQAWQILPADDARAAEARAIIRSAIVSLSSPGEEG